MPMVMFYRYIMYIYVCVYIYTRKPLSEMSLLTIILRIGSIQSQSTHNSQTTTQDLGEC